jgi:hypothetical protein
MIARRCQRRISLAQVTLLAALGLTLPAPAELEVSLASYESTETDLTVSAQHPSDPGLTVTIVPGDENGAPAATDGQQLLQIEFVGEDGKIEFTHQWSATTYSLDGATELRADLFVQTATALPGLVGIWDAAWHPPDAWQSATGSPAVGAWRTISFDVSQRTQSGLNQIWAFVLEDLPGADGVAYLDNLRLVYPGSMEAPTELAANAFASHTELVWRDLSAVDPDGYFIYRAMSAGGPFVQLNDTPLPTTAYTDLVGAGAPMYYYRVTAVVDGEESAPSNTVAALYNGLTDAELLTLVQQSAFGYFWDYAHPVSGAIREGYTHWDEIVASGGTGMGLMAIVVGAERGFVSRADAAERTLQILTFLEDSAERYHGAWSHWIHGTTGATIPFGTYDDGGDLVETSYVVQGVLTARRYFTADDPVENEIRERATRLWEEVEWDWYRRFPTGQALYWHWSPTYGWQMDMPILGYMEAMITYLLAIASPTHSMPASAYYSGWASQPYYENGNTYYGYLQWVGPPYGGPLFFTHYSHLGFDPRYKSDAYCDYFANSRNISLIHQAHSIVNPNDYAGYNEWLWGLTASSAPPEWGYLAHSPTNDTGTVAPTAALSALPFTPAESLATIRYLYDSYGDVLWGPYGFYDALPVLAAVHVEPGDQADVAEHRLGVRGGCRRRRQCHRR